MALLILMLICFLIAALFFLYILPTIIALKRNHKNTLAIAVLNILFGWCGICWGIALIWSLIND